MIHMEYVLMSDNENPRAERNISDIVTNTQHHRTMAANDVFIFILNRPCQKYMMVREKNMDSMRTPVMFGEVTAAAATAFIKHPTVISAINSGVCSDVPSIGGGKRIKERSYGARHNSQWSLPFISTHRWTQSR